MALTIRQEMAKNSVWETKDEFEIEIYSKAIWEYVPDPKDPGRHIHVQKKKVTQTIPKGVTALVLDKMTTYVRGNFIPTENLFVPIKFDDPSLHKGGYWVSFSVAAAHLTLVSSVVQLVYALYSPSKGYVVDIPSHWWNEETRKHVEAIEAQGGIEYSDKLTKSRRKKRLQDVKQFLLSHSGYYDNIDTSDIYYVFEPGGKKVSFPDDLEIQEIDKATKAVMQTWSAKEYLDASHRLRPLTEKYGTCVRTLVKDIEKNLSEYTSLLLFKDTKGLENHYDDGATPGIQQLKKAVKDMKLAKDVFKMKADKGSVVMAFKNKSDAVMFRLTYSGDVGSELLNAATLEAQIA